MFGILDDICHAVSLECVARMLDGIVSSAVAFMMSKSVVKVFCIIILLPP